MAHNALLRKQAQDTADINTLLRVAQRAEATTRVMIDEIRDEVTSVFKAHDARISNMETGFRELNQWAEKVADKADPGS